MKAKSKPIAVILIRSGSRGLVDKNINRSRSSLQAI